MNLYIPEIGDLILLTEDWFFKLHYERRNDSLITASKLADLSYHSSGRSTPQKPIEMDLPKGTVLAIDRIYIRKGASDYSSITFRIKKCITSNFEGKRFWAKLSDCNTIEFEKLIDEAKKEKPKPSECTITLIDGSRGDNITTLYPELNAKNWKGEANYDINIELLLISKEYPTPLKGSINVKFSVKKDNRGFVTNNLFPHFIGCNVVCQLQPINRSKGMTVKLIPSISYNGHISLYWWKIEEIFSKDPNKIARYFKG